MMGGGIEWGVVCRLVFRDVFLYYILSHTPPELPAEADE